MQQKSVFAKAIKNFVVQSVDAARQSVITRHDTCKLYVHILHVQISSMYIFQHINTILFVSVLTMCIQPIW